MTGAMKITGARELQRALARLPEELSKSVERTVLREGAKPIHSSAKSRVAVSSGLLKKSLGITVKKTRKGQLTARVGARSGFKKTVTRNGKTVNADPAKYSHLVEYGTSHSPAKPFIRPAIDSASGQVMEAMAKGYDKGLDRVVRKIRSKK